MTASAPAVFVLVHPESFPSNSWDVDDDEYGARVRAAAAGTKQIAVLDTMAVEDLDDYDDLTVGVPAAGWDILEFNPHELDAAARQIAATLTRGTRIAVGGYHRDDCVRRTIEGLRGHGMDAYLDEPTTLPYPWDEDYARSLGPDWDGDESPETYWDEDA